MTELPRVQMLQLHERQARQLNAQAKVIQISRTALDWWPTVVDRYPTLAAPWVGALRLALAELDKVEG